MNQHMTERRLVDVLVSFLRRNHKVKREMRFYEKRIDVVATPTTGDVILAIEAKTNDWRRATSQAVVNLAAADRSYIAVPSNYAHRVSPDVLERHGLGLIAVGSRWGEVEFLREAKNSPYVNRLARDRIKASLRGGKDAR